MLLGNCGADLPVVVMCWGFLWYVIGYIVGRMKDEVPFSRGNKKG